MCDIFLNNTKSKKITSLKTHVSLHFYNSSGKVYNISLTHNVSFGEFIEYKAMSVVYIKNKNVYFKSSGRKVQSEYVLKNNDSFLIHDKNFNYTSILKNYHSWVCFSKDVRAPSHYTKLNLIDGRVLFFFPHIDMGKTLDVIIENGMLTKQLSKVMLKFFIKVIEQKKKTQRIGLNNIVVSNRTMKLLPSKNNGGMYTSRKAVVFLIKDVLKYNTYGDSIRAKLQNLKRTVTKKHKVKYSKSELELKAQVTHNIENEIERVKRELEELRWKQN